MTTRRGGSWGMAAGPRLLVRSAPRFRLGSVMRASERRHGVAAVRNSSFIDVILATAAFFQIDEKKYDAFGRNIDTTKIKAPWPTLRKLERLLL
ncbi:hypothetical protein [Mesorhizobium captivum]|uniref:PIN domain-containing protein n=1 Tax=Mesorhizobium captivum TaxID=3072319 RepID=A0ABU4YXA3_9HYPH|nr:MULTISPECIES: hypothetical protein [unclassified Mesorhizobium]MDX8445150.1 hypothetical protein [Mesorhizobium sp. VK3C]MDX8491331.1 hypothetical protein [Mesorhizobium sp. VK22B]MDX8505748.1 hypothetical protein [Mesorhizobium sp. VK22E]